MWKNLLLQPALDNGSGDQFTGVKNNYKKTPTFRSGLLPDQARDILSCKK
jgi:hypothetical protein